MRNYSKKLLQNPKKRRPVNVIDYVPPSKLFQKIVLYF